MIKKKTFIEKITDHYGWVWQKVLLIGEPIILANILFRFWFHSPPLRDQWVWLLFLAIPVFRLRWVVYDRLWTRTPLNDWLWVFILLTGLNFAHAPFARQDYLVLMSRPLLGVWLYLYLVELARCQQRLHELLSGTLVVSAIIGFAAFTTTSWEMNKSADFATLIAQIPRFDWRSATPPIDQMLLAFNPNEIAGALSFLIPITAALSIERAKTLFVGIRLIAGVLFGLLFLGLIITQSRFAIGGTLIALVLVVFALAKSSTKRYALLAALCMVALFQIALILNLGPFSDGDGGLSERDQTTASTRGDLWSSAFQMMLDYPLTGTGMSMFRAAVQQEAYQIPYYVERGTVPPHAHNEWLQMGADLGFPGFILYLIWQAVVIRMAWIGWRIGNDLDKMVAVGALAGLLAHSIYGLGDAITLWDRFSFLNWWLVGLIGAQYIVAMDRLSGEPNPNPIQQSEGDMD